MDNTNEFLKAKKKEKMIYNFKNLVEKFLFFLFFITAPTIEVLGLGVKSELQLQAYATAQQHQIWATSATYAAAHGNAKSLTYRARLGIEPASALILVGFLTQRATTGTLQNNYFLKIILQDQNMWNK